MLGLNQKNTYLKKSKSLPRIFDIFENWPFQGNVVNLALIILIYSEKLRLK